MRWISEEELRKWLITDGCAEGHGYIDEDDFVCMDWQDNPTKTGHWIDKFAGVYRCSCCREIIEIDIEIDHPNGITFNYCPNCGCRMVEPQERSDKE